MSKKPYKKYSDARAGTRCLPGGMERCYFLAPAEGKEKADRKKKARGVDFADGSCKEGNADGRKSWELCSARRREDRERVGRKS